MPKRVTDPKTLEEAWQQFVTRTRTTDNMMRRSRVAFFAGASALLELIRKYPNGPASKDIELEIEKGLGEEGSNNRR